MTVIPHHLPWMKLVMIRIWIIIKVSQLPKILLYLNRTRTTDYTVIKFFKSSHYSFRVVPAYKEKQEAVGRQKAILPQRTTNLYQRNKY